MTRTTAHLAPGLPPVPCLKATGACLLCDMLDRDGPKYREDVRRLFHPEEFPREGPVVAPEASTPASNGLVSVPQPPQVHPPSFVRKAMNFGKALVTHAVEGFPSVDDATHDARLAICRGCEHFNAEHVSCNKCGCGMEVKTRWADQACPVGKWGKETAKS